ncbi:hypothetical protein AA0Z99_05930 [Agrococcus sp. 1P02AA]|uniref:hypothetical protein n=1 Tax=Agrococcus sp. 1P02AA TaxID=3132259 RepID=UPI0039A5B021
MTPTVVTGGLLALTRLYDPPTRWARKIKSDITILSGLADDAEKDAWQASIDQQAARIREYRRAFVGWTLFWKWFVVGCVAMAVLGLILYPPVNEAGQPAGWGPADYIMILGGLYLSVIYVVAVSAGHDFLGRSPRELLLLRRLRRHNRRHRRLLRVTRATRGPVRPSVERGVSWLGFRTQVDEFGQWMRDPDLRGYVRNAGFVSADIRGRYYADLRRRGVPIPTWPAVGTRGLSASMHTAKPKDARG